MMMIDILLWMCFVILGFVFGYTLGYLHAFRLQQKDGEGE